MIISLIKLEMDSKSGKIVDRKQDLKSVGDSKEIRQAAESKASAVFELDLSFN